MTTNKDFKRLVRGRMEKTGESYTAARARLLEKARAAGSPRKKPGAAARPEAGYAGLAGWSDATVEAKTGCNWEKWVNALDYKKAQDWSHGEIARYVRETFGVSGWWSQAVAVGYERIKGRRAIGQRVDGHYEVAKSKTLPVPAARLYRQFSDRRNRGRWLPGIEPTIRTATAGKSLRMTWPDGTSVQAFFEAKGKAKSTVHIAHGRLPDKAAADRTRAFWTERLAALAARLA